MNAANLTDETFTDVNMNFWSLMGKWNQAGVYLLHKFFAVKACLFLTWPFEHIKCVCVADM